MSDTFNTLQEALAGFGVTLIERTRLTFGAPVLKALSETPVKGGKVFVTCKGSPDALKGLMSKLDEETRKSVRMIDASEHDYAKVRPHVSTFCKGRKMPVSINAIQDADGINVAFTVTRKTQ